MKKVLNLLVCVFVVGNVWAEAGVLGQLQDEYNKCKAAMICLQQEGWGSCSSAQRKRIVVAGGAIVLFVAIGGAFAICELWKKAEKKEWETFGCAIIDRDTVVVKQMLEKNPNLVNKQSGDGWTPLHYVKDVETARVLVEYGAKVNATNEHGDTPLHSAVLKGNQAVVVFLVQNGAAVNIPDKDGDTPLHWAVSEGVKQIVKELVDKGADVNAKAENGDTPLLVAITADYDQENNRKEIIQFLTDHGVHVSQGDIDIVDSQELVAFLQESMKKQQNK